MSDRFGWTIKQWDAMEPEEKGNLIANLNYWANRREKERKEAQEKLEKDRG